MSFTKALETLSRRYHVAFICEDAPQEDTVSAAIVPESLRDSDNLSPEAARQKAVETVAAAFDYSASRLGTTFLLRKRYTKIADDLPSVTLEECALALRDAKRALAAVNPNVAPFNGQMYPLSDHLMKSLTQDQLAAMFNGAVNVGNTSGGKPLQGVTMDGVPLEGREQKSSKGVVELGVPIRSLTPAQQADVRKIAAYYYVQSPLNNLAEISTELDAVTNPNAVFHFEPFQYADYPACRSLGCVTPGKTGKPDGKKQWCTVLMQIDPDKGMTPLPNASPEDLAARYDVVIGGGNMSKPKDPAEMDKFLGQARDLIDKSLGAAKSGIEAQQKRRAKGLSRTLEQAAKELSRRPAPPGRKENGRGAVDPALGSKRVTLVGTENLSALSVWTSVARLYDLSTREMPDGSVLLTRPRQKVARNLSEVSDAMKNVLPAPLRNMTEYRQQHTMGKTARYRFEYLAKKAAASSPNGEFTLKDLGEDGQRYLALMIVGGGYIDFLLKMAQPTPSLITDFDNQLLIGGLYIAPNGETQFSVSFAKEDNPGALSQGPGFGGVKYKH